MRKPTYKTKTQLGSRTAKPQPGSRPGSNPIPNERDLAAWETKAQELQPRGFLLAEPVLILVAAVRLLKRELVQLHSRIARIQTKAVPSPDMQPKTGILKDGTSGSGTANH